MREDVTRRCILQELHEMLVSPRRIELARRCIVAQIVPTTAIAAAFAPRALPNLQQLVA